MITLPLPDKINGDQLSIELGGASVWINEDGLNIKSDKTKIQIEEIVAKHFPIDFMAEKQAKKQTILNRLGITEEEAKLLFS